jgi:hypothetical protein
MVCNLRIIFKRISIGNFRDEAIELADHALKLTKDERIKEFSDVLNSTQNKNKKQSKNSIENFI